MATRGQRRRCDDLSQGYWEWVFADRRSKVLIGNQRYLSRLSEEARRNVGEMQRHFGRVNGPWKFERMISYGYFGCVVLVSRTESLLRPPRRLVLKRALTNRGEDELRNEIIQYTVFTPQSP